MLVASASRYSFSSLINPEYWSCLTPALADLRLTSQIILMRQIHLKLRMKSLVDVFNNATDENNQHVGNDPDDPYSWFMKQLKRLALSKVKEENRQRRFTECIALVRDMRDKLNKDTRRFYVETINRNTTDV